MDENLHIDITAWRNGDGNSKLKITVTLKLFAEVLALLKGDGYNEFDIQH